MAQRYAFKVLRDDLSSVGLLGAAHMRYRFGVWNRPADGISDHPRKGGGLWVAPTLGDARAMQRYVWRKHGIRTRIFRCRIGRVLHETSCRIKTTSVFFTASDEV